MRIKTVGNKRDNIMLVVRNADTVQLNLGQPVFLNKLNGTNDGLDVVGANTLNDATAMAVYGYGVVASPANGSSPGIAANQYGEVIAFGFTPDIQITLATRANSGANWSSWASIQTGVQLVPESTANGFTTTPIQSFRTDAISTGNVVGFSGFLPYAVLGQTVASGASSTSATSDTRTIITSMVKGFVRFL